LPYFRRYVAQNLPAIARLPLDLGCLDAGILDGIWAEIAENSGNLAENGGKITENGEKITENGEQLTENGEKMAENGENSSKSTENSSKWSQNTENGSKNGGFAVLEALIPLDRRDRLCSRLFRRALAAELKITPKMAGKWAKTAENGSKTAENGLKTVEKWAKMAKNTENGLKNTENGFKNTEIGDLMLKNGEFGGNSADFPDFGRFLRAFSKSGANLGDFLAKEWLFLCGNCGKIVSKGETDSCVKKLNFWVFFGVFGVFWGCFWSFF
jgi:hypothetical protein